MTASLFSWLDYDADQSRRASELIKALSESETVDSIGIGAVRDGIAGLLFPGTSTVQTRVRYFLLVPWAMQHVARRRPRSRAQYDRLLREVESAIIDQLIKGSEKGTRGIIGSERRERTQRMPSAIYWASLGRWGIRVDRDLTLTGYRDWVLAPRSRDLIDGETGEGVAYLVFDELPSAPPGFPEEPMPMLPTQDESEYLLGRMRAIRLGGHLPDSWNRDPGPSLLALVAEAPELAELPNFWDLPADILPAEIKIITHHARMFSDVMQGARLRYVQLLFETQRRQGLPESPGHQDLQSLVDEWLQQVTDQWEAVISWTAALPQMFELLARHGVAIGGATREFVRTWTDMVAKDPREAMSGARSGNLIRSREETLKAPYNRLGNPSALRSWDGALFGRRPLDYRWGISSRLVLDCRDGIQGSNAGT